MCIEVPCLVRLLVLGKIRIGQMFGLCNLPNANFGLLISLVQFFGYFCPKNRTNEINSQKYSWNVLINHVMKFAQMKFAQMKFAQMKFA